MPATRWVWVITMVLDQQIWVHSPCTPIKVLQLRPTIAEAESRVLGLLFFYILVAGRWPIAYTFLSGIYSCATGCTSECSSPAHVSCIQEHSYPFYLPLASSNCTLSLVEVAMCRFLFCHQPHWTSTTK